MARNIFLPTQPTLPITNTPPIDSTVILDQGMGFMDYFLVFVASVIVLLFLIWFLRLIIEIFLARRLVYVQVSLPRSDSKLDKEHETKKDFKEKMGIMNLVHNALWRLATMSLKNTFLNFFLHHIKVSYELIYKE